jgi:SAM-dependent methyltransferase
MHREGTLARCLDCGLVSVEPLPTPEAALLPYDASYFQGEAGYRDYAGEERVFRAEFRRRLVRMRAAGAAGRLLDVGAATGALLAEARDAGFDVAGIEPSPAAETATARGLDVFHGPIEAAAFAPESFDVVTIFDVLEHLVAPDDVLGRIGGWLRPGGRLFVAVPDFGGWWARGSGARWPMVTPKEHLHYFTRRTLGSMLRTAGFQVDSIGLAGTPVSFGSLARKGLGTAGRVVERLLGRLASRGTALPFGTIFASAIRAASGTVSETAVRAR